MRKKSTNNELMLDLIESSSESNSVSASLTEDEGDETMDATLNPLEPSWKDDCNTGSFVS